MLMKPRNGTGTGTGYVLCCGTGTGTGTGTVLAGNTVSFGGRPSPLRYTWQLHCVLLAHYHRRRLLVRVQVPGNGSTHSLPAALFYY